MAGSFNDPVAVTGFGNRCGFALDPEREVVIVAASARAGRRTPRASSRAVGFTQLAEVGFGIDAAHAHARFEPIGLVEMGQLADAGELQVVDLREASEQTEMAAGALPVPYRLLAEADLSTLDPERPTAVVCHTGTRSPLGCVAAGAPRIHARAPRARRGHERLGHARGRRPRPERRGGRDQG